MKPVKIAILSCNHGHGKAYYNLINDPFFELVAVSVEPTYRDKVFLERLPGIPKYDSDEELYQNHPDVEAVIIASSNRKHIEQTRVAVEKGLHIFSMKVPTFSIDEYEEMIALTEKRGVVCQVELEMREHSEIYLAKELLDSGEIGDPLSITMINYSHNPIWWRPWQCSPEESFGKRIRLREGDGRYRGGALADHPHIFDAIQLITGSKFDTVFAEVAPNLRDVETEDLVHIIGKLKNGMTYSLDPSYANNEHRVVRQIDWIKYPHPVEVTLNIVGTKGVIIGDAYNRSVYMQTGARGEYLAGDAGDCIGKWNKRMLEFYHCIRDGKKPRVGLREHYDTVKTMLAAYESISTGKVVKM